MDKNELLKQVQSLATQHLVSRDEVTAAFDAGASGDTDVEVSRQTGISYILYYVGGAVVFLGISVLIWQHWSTLNSATKILCTLGSGVAAYIAAVFLSQNERFEIPSRAFYFISALVMPLGLHITFHIAGLD